MRTSSQTPALAVSVIDFALASPLSVPSTDGKIIATLVQCQLILRSARSLEITRTIDVDPEFAARVSFLRWSSDRTQDEPASSRILLADQDTVNVWDRHDEKWRATINGAGGGVGKIANVEFGCNEDEIVIWSEYSAKVTVWLVVTGNSIEIKDPKFIRNGFGYRPRTGHFTLLTRAAAHDTITIHEPTTYKLLSSFNIPTIDARGLCWSPCGRWLAVWDSASSGYKILVYTPDGHLFRTYTGAQGDNAGGLGVKTVEWSPLTNYLIVGGYENRVIALNRVTVLLPRPLCWRIADPFIVLSDDVSRPSKHRQSGKGPRMAGNYLSFGETQLRQRSSAHMSACRNIDGRRYGPKDWDIRHHA